MIAINLRYTSLICTTLGACVVSSMAFGDFGQRVQDMLAAESNELFGVTDSLASSTDFNRQREPGQSAYDLANYAGSLTARILTRNAGNKADMFALWPNDNLPTHAIFCIEGDVEVIGTLSNGREKLNPSVQTIDLSSGEVKTMIRGMSRCDGIRTTAWNTVLVTEEYFNGQAYEIINPLSFTEHTVTDRISGTIVDLNNVVSSTVVKWDALPTMAWEGLGILDNGVVIAGDELRPGTKTPDANGGSIYKFVPAIEASGPITSLSDSPFSAGSVYAMQVSCQPELQQFGQGCEVGAAAWIPVSASSARSDANVMNATGFYRPEDLHLDPVYTGPGVRFCWANTGNKVVSNFGEVICGVDLEPTRADANSQTVIVNRFVEGDTEFNSLDNLAFQPVTGNLIVLEDHKNGDVFSCLPDGTDRDRKTDGCVRIVSLKDQTAEPTGFEFFGDGRSALLSVQHSDDSLMPLHDDYATDDIILITGFKVEGDASGGVEDPDPIPVGEVSGARYDRRQGEIFWSKAGFSAFNIYRDGVLQNASVNTGSSFYQKNLVDGVSYRYEVWAVTDVGEVLLGGVLLPVN